MKLESVFHVLRTWPGTAGHVAPDALERYVDAIVWPNGRDRAPRTDSGDELLDALLELRVNDATGRRPAPPLVVSKLAERRTRRRAA